MKNIHPTHSTWLSGVNNFSPHGQFCGLSIPFLHKCTQFYSSACSCACVCLCLWCLCLLVYSSVWLTPLPPCSAPHGRYRPWVVGERVIPSPPHQPTPPDSCCSHCHQFGWIMFEPSIDANIFCLALLVFD